jgi:hypothetical protein
MMFECGFVKKWFCPENPLGNHSPIKHMGYTDIPNFERNPFVPWLRHSASCIASAAGGTSEQTATRLLQHWKEK